ncbi:unnamed protein product [Cuscuta epithymum]|uniref:Uncharacterized protein n=1 Tax=Cuscuta epithymum TaxID=186058 RepID=A0AAV0EZV1_9ASTE|nr:unnamed protein product [Cuscuta epithymum]CAH9128792.1 unnamed protein product [Cuscuta epithymum]
MKRIETSNWERNGVLAFPHRSYLLPVSSYIEKKLGTCSEKSADWNKISFSKLFCLYIFRSDVSSNLCSYCYILIMYINVSILSHDFEINFHETFCLNISNITYYVCT